MVILYIKFFIFSDTMGNRGAFITLNGKDMEPHFTSYEGVVCYKLINSFRNF